MLDETVMAGTVGENGMIRLSKAQEEADEAKAVSDDEAKYKGTIGMALSTVDRKLSHEIAQRDKATDGPEKAKLEAETSRLASMMTVLELNTGLTNQMIDKRQALRVHEMDKPNAARYSDIIKEQAWKSLTLDQAIDRVRKAWTETQETQKANPAVLAQQEQAFKDAEMLLMQLKLKETKIR